MVTARATYRVRDRNTLIGSLRVQAKNGVVAHLPAQYVREHTTLAYASTTHAAQGALARGHEGWSHVVPDGKIVDADGYA